MGSLLRKLPGSQVAVWSLLVLVTILSWKVGGQHHRSEEPIAVGLFALAGVKAYLVGENFMELRRNVSIPRIALLACCALLPIVLSGVYCGAQ